MSECYIARKACGCIVVAVVDNPEHKKDTAKTIAECVRKGLTIERVTDEYVRQNMRRCQCAAEAKRALPGG